MKPCSFAVTLMMVVTLVAVSSASADDATELAKKLANPISSLISLPIQANYDENFGSDEEGERWLINVQPVIPISLNEDWNIISRTIVPIIDQKNMQLPELNKSGLGDITQSIFFSPKAPTSSG